MHLHIHSDVILKYVDISVCMLYLIYMMSGIFILISLFVRNIFNFDDIDFSVSAKPDILVDIYILCLL